MAKTDYPDLSAPMGASDQYPDLSMPMTASQQLETQAYQQAQPMQEMRQPQEEFSNPTQYPGFENLSKQEKLQRIGLSQFDLANQTATGGFFPPGAYEAPATRMVASVAPTFAIPVLRTGSPIMQSIVNALGRVAGGTASNVAYQSPNINSLDQLKDVAKQSASMNALIEAPITALKGIRGSAEIYNPYHRYAAQKANDINREAIAAKALQRETYRPVFQQYGNAAVTENPGQYLMEAGIEKRRLYPESKKTYDKFIQNPTFQNLHNLQSVVGKDLRRVGKDTSKPLTTQRFKEYRNNLQDLATQFLGRDENALAQYNLGSQITRDLVSPFEVNTTLKQISRGTRLQTKPQEISNAIKKGREKIISEIGGKPTTAIPDNHPLVRHFNEINNRLNIGQGLQKVTPKLAKEFLPDVGGIIQNPSLNRFMENANPFYYGAGRVLINEKNK